jgi:Squalene/phytoene synthase
MSLPPLLFQHRVSTEDLFECKGELVVELTKELAARAYDQLVQCREYRRSVEPLNDQFVAKVFLPAIYCEDYLQQLREADFDVFNPHIQSSTPIRLPIRLLWASTRNRF